MTALRELIVIQRLVYASQMNLKDKPGVGIIVDYLKDYTVVNGV